MDQSHSIAARTRHASTSSSHSSPAAGHLTIYSGTIPSMVRVQQAARAISFSGGVNHGTSPCPYTMAVAYAHAGGPAAASYSLVQRAVQQAQQQHIHNAMTAALVGSGGAPAANGGGGHHLYLSGCAGLHPNNGGGGYHPRTSTATVTAPTPAVMAAQTPYFDAAVDMNLLQAAAAAAAASSPPFLVQNRNTTTSHTNGARFLHDLGAAIEADRNRHHQHQFHRQQQQQQQQFLATHARRTALSAASAALSYESTGGLESTPLSVEEMALDASTLEQALATDRLGSTRDHHASSRSSIELFDPTIEEDLALFRQDVEEAEETQNTTRGAKNNRGREPCLTSPIANISASSTSLTQFLNLNSSQDNPTSSSSSRAVAASPQRATRKTLTRSTARRKTNTTNASPTSPTTGGDANANRSTQDRAVCSAESSTIEDRKKPAVIRIRKEEKQIIPPSSKTVEEEESTCCICMDICIKLELSAINSCKHKFCFTCIEKWADRENTCPLCKERFTKIERVYKPPSRKRKSDTTGTPARCRNSKRVKNRSQRSDFMNGNAFQGLLASMDGALPNSLAQFIFNSIPGGSLVSVSRGPGHGRSGAGSGGTRVFAATGAVPFVDLSFSPTLSLEEGVARGSNWGGASRSAAAAAAYPGVAEGHRVRSSSNNIGQQQQQQMPRHSDMILNASHGTFGSIRTTRRSESMQAMPSLSNNNINNIFTVDTSDEESEADVEEVNMFIQHVRSIANRSSASSARDDFFVDIPYDPNRGQVRSMPMDMLQGEGSTPPRSYAINDHEVDAGATAENALEIVDSDSDDDVVEILMRTPS